MRLVCPNCGAQYEVDDRVVPEGGRDVQCSSCGHAWYQMPAHLDAAAQPALTEPEALADAEDDAAAEFEPDLEPETEYEAEYGAETEVAHEPAAAAAPPAETPAETLTEAVEAEPEVADEPAAAASPAETLTEEVAPDTPAEEADTASAPEATPEATPEDEESPFPGEGAAEAPARRELDQNLRAILQEEVAREMEAREADREPEAAETEPDTGLDSAPDGAVEPHGFTGAPSAEIDDGDGLPDISLSADADAGAAGATAPRRDLFPDIEEINSTLDSRGVSEEEFEDEEAEGRGGFSRGFFAIIFVAALALALYLVAPRLADTIPALEPALSAYVGAVNAAREWLDGMVQNLTSKIGGPDQP